MMKNLCRQVYLSEVSVRQTPSGLGDEYSGNYSLTRELKTWIAWESRDCNGTLFLDTLLSREW